MPVKRRKTNPTATPTSAVTVDGVEGTPSFSEAAHELALALIETCLAGDLEGAAVLVGQGADAWVQDTEGWSALHAAASAFLSLLQTSERANEGRQAQGTIRSSPSSCASATPSGTSSITSATCVLPSGSLWHQLTLAQTAGDIAYSLNDSTTYAILLAEGLRAELLRAVMEQLSPPSPPSTEEGELSTAGDNATFLASKLRFTTDSQGQEICVDREDNGVMMGWERGLMEESARKLCAAFEGRRKGEELEEELNVVNVGFGLGIVSPFDLVEGEGKLTRGADRWIPPGVHADAPSYYRAAPGRAGFRTLKRLVRTTRRAYF